MLTNREELVEGIKVEGSPGYSDYEMLEFKTLREVGKTSGITTLYFRRTDFGFFMDLLGRFQWATSL